MEAVPGACGGRVPELLPEVAIRGRQCRGPVQAQQVAGVPLELSAEGWSGTSVTAPATGSSLGTGTPCPWGWGKEAPGPWTRPRLLRYTSQEWMHGIDKRRRVNFDVALELTAAVVAPV
jgi:hypothetical protein